MESWKIGQNIDENMRLNTRKCSPSVVNADTLDGIHNLRKRGKARVLFRACEYTVFVFLMCAFVYSCKSLWDLKSEIGNLKEQIKSEVFLRDRIDNTKLEGENWTTTARDKEMWRTLKGDRIREAAPSKTYRRRPTRLMSETDKFTELLIRERDPSSLRPDTEEDLTSVENGILKRKREIKLSEENGSEHSTSVADKKSTPSMYSVPEEYSSEYSYAPLAESSNWTIRKPHRNHKRFKKHNRYSVAPEKFFTDIESTTSTPIQVRQSRTKFTDDSQERKHRNDMGRKPLLQSYGSKESITREEALMRPMRPKDLLSGNGLENRVQYGNDSGRHSPEPKQLPDTILYNAIMVHYAADTSHYAKDANPHYFGNGRIQMRTSIYKDWKPIHWTQGVDISKYFTLSEGKTAVSITGIYLIYAQVQYSNKQEVNGYAVMCNNQPVVQCITTSIHPNKEEVKSNTCDTSTTILLRSNDRIFIQDLHHGRHVVLTPEKSYFGLILLSPFKKNE